MNGASNIKEFKADNYASWIESLSVRYRQSQIKVAVAVNTEMLKFYFGLGHDLSLMEKDQPWGSGFLKRVSLDLKTKMPMADCFSPRNLYYMRGFFELYAKFLILPQVEAKLNTEDISPPQDRMEPLGRGSIGFAERPHDRRFRISELSHNV